MKVKNYQMRVKRILHISIFLNSYSNLFIINKLQLDESTFLVSPAIQYILIGYKIS